MKDPNAIARANLQAIADMRESAETRVAILKRVALDSLGALMVEVAKPENDDSRGIKDVVRLAEAIVKVQDIGKGAY